MNQIEKDKVERILEVLMPGQGPERMPLLKDLVWNPGKKNSDKYLALLDNALCVRGEPTATPDRIRLTEFWAINDDLTLTHVEINQRSKVGVFLRCVGNAAQQEVAK